MPLQDITMSQTLPLMNGEYFYLILDIKFFPDQFQIENSWNLIMQIFDEKSSRWERSWKEMPKR